VKGRPTLADVAKAAGVTPGAVSLILRESGRFSDITRQRVKRAAARLKYRPNPILASYKTGKFRGDASANAVPIAFVSRHYLSKQRASEPVGGAVTLPGEARARALGYQMQGFDLGDYDNPMRLGDILYARGVRGVILGQLYGWQELPDLGWQRFACVCLSRPFFKVPFDVVRDRIVETMTAAFEEVRRRGYERIGFDVQIHRSWGALHPDDKARMAAALYCQHQQPRRLRLPIHQGRASEEGSFLDWVRNQKPDVVIASLGARREHLQRGGYRVPQDLAFVALQIRNNEAAIESGFLVRRAIDGEKAVEILDHHIRHNLIGPRQDPMEHLAYHPWNEGASLPDRAGSER